MSHSTRSPEPDPSPDVVQFPLTNGGFTLVDAADVPLLAGWSWRWQDNRSKDHRYVKGQRRIDGKNTSVMLHRLLMNPPKDMFVDHINGDGLDNRRCNLRICTLQQNTHNRRRCRHAKNPYIGVQLSRHSTRRWRAEIKEKGKVYRLGTFSSPEEAARAYDRAAKEMRGEFAYLNFPDESEAA